MKALVAGGAGVLGSAITKLLLQKDYDVEVMEILQQDQAYRLKPVMPVIQYTWKSIHDLHTRDLQGVDLFVLCAAQPDRPFALTSPRTTMWMNVMGLTQVLEVCRHSFDLQKFLFPSSGSTFIGVPPCELPCKEDSHPAPTNPYSASKYMCEILTQTYHRAFAVPSVIIRSGIVYGPDMRLDVSIAQFTKKAYRDQKFSVRSPYATRTPTFVDDVMLYWDAIIDAPPEEVVGQTFHSVYGNEWAVIDIARMICKIVGQGEPVADDYYEEGESIHGQNAREWMVSTKDEQLGVKPQFNLERGLARSVAYINKRINSFK